MSSLLVIHHNHTLIQEQEDILSQLPGWNIYFFDTKYVSLNQIEQSIKKKEIHFLLFSTELESDSSDKLSKLHKSHPLLSIIYYNSQLKSGEFADLYHAGIDYCIIGDARQINLIKTLNHLWETHWRRIPKSLLPEKADLLPDRANRTLHFIENQPIKFFNSNDISEYLSISESHFRTEFKKCFNISFREFKQQLLFHYEMILLFEKKLKPKEIFEVLNYKNISAFSRSFRIRHGQSWQDLIKEKRNYKVFNIVQTETIKANHGKQKSRLHRSKV